jgi:hypothetical protein
VAGAGGAGTSAAGVAAGGGVPAGAASNRWLHLAQRSRRGPPASSVSGTSYSAEQLGQAMRILSECDRRRAGAQSPAGR